MHNLTAYKYYEVGGIHEGYVLAKNLLEAQKLLIKKYGSIDNFEAVWAFGITYDHNNPYVIEM